MPRSVAVFDKNLDPNVFVPTLSGWNRISAATRRPKSPYIGHHATDEDHRDFLQLVWENDALGVTADGAMLEKAWEFGRCGSRGHRLNGVIIVPPRLPEQVDRLSALVSGELRVEGIDADDDPLDAICTNNLGVDLRQKVPEAIELCDCPWDEDEERRRKRFKRK
jgi:hypothetical protein